MRTFPWKWTSAALTACALIAAAAPATAGAASPVVGHVYTDGNTASGNTIDGFNRHADGSLTPMAGSPFAAGGNGTGATIASQGSVALAGHYLLTVDAGSNQVSVLRVHPDGSLSLRSVTASGGTDPVSITVHKHLVYVANAGPEHSNYTGFRLSHGGQLTPLAGSTFALPNGSQPGQVLFNATGTNLAGVRVATSLIDSFSVGADGRITPAPGSPIAAQGPGPFGSEFRPTNPSQLFVSNAHGGAGNGSVSAFDVAGDGTLTSIGDSPFADHQTAPCWVEISADGRYLFTVNTGSGSVSSYRIADNGSLALLGSVSVGEKSGPLDLRLSPDGHTLYVLRSATHTLDELTVNGGNLTPLGAVSLAAGATGAGLAAN